MGEYLQTQGNFLKQLPKLSTRNSKLFNVRSKSTIDHDSRVRRGPCVVPARATLKAKSSLRTDLKVTNFGTCLLREVQNPHSLRKKTESSFSMFNESIQEHVETDSALGPGPLGSVYELPPLQPMVPAESARVRHSV